MNVTAILLTIVELLTPGPIHASPAEIWPSIHAVDQHQLWWSIKRMPYTSFVRTPYWYAVSSAIKDRAGHRCQLCGAGGEMHVHHRDYKKHGGEHDHMNDLICLCREHHLSYHANDKTAKPKAPKVKSWTSNRAANVIQGQGAYITQRAHQRRLEGMPDRKKAQKMIVEIIANQKIRFDELKRRVEAVPFWYRLIE